MDERPLAQINVPMTLLGMRIDEIDSTSESADERTTSRRLVEIDRPSAPVTHDVRRLAPMGAAAVVIAAALLLGSFSSRRADTTADAPIPEMTAAPGRAAPIVESDRSTAPTTLATPFSIDGHACAQVSGPVADVDEDGCAEAIAVDGATIMAGAHRFVVGEAGDQLAVGDWNCDGSSTPAALRPSTGELFVFDTWGAPDRPTTISPTMVIPGARSIEAAPSASCAALTVRLSGDRTRRVTIPGGA